MITRSKARFLRNRQDKCKKDCKKDCKTDCIKDDNQKYPLESYGTYMSHEDLQGAPIESSGKMTFCHFSNRILKDNKEKPKQKKYKKKSIPKAIKDQVWIKYNGYNFEAKCNVSWCINVISAFNFHAGHNIPESKGGQISIENLRPICSTCNSSMKDNYTIDEWNNMGWSKIKSQQKHTNIILCLKILLLGLACIMFYQ